MKYLPLLLIHFSLLLIHHSSAAAPATADGSKAPNFIIIFTDDQGYQDLSCFGSKEIKTPHIDRMASEGRMLTSFYSANLSAPPRAQL